MAKLYMTHDKDQQHAEAYVTLKTAEETRRQDVYAKKSLLTVVMCIFVIMISVAAVIFVLFYPGVLGSILGTVKKALLSWKNSLLDYILMPESPQQSVNTAEKVWLGFLLVIDWLLRTLGKALLFVLEWTYPVLIVGGLLVVAFLIIRWSIGRMEYNYWRKPKKKEIQDRVIQSMPSEMAKTYDECQGETHALEALLKLDDDCHIFVDLNIVYDGESSKTDLIVVSPTAVSVVEVKNYTGLLFGDLSEKNLTQWQYLDDGKHKETREPNPVKQLGSAVYILSHLLKNQGISVYVQSCALFANENVQLHITDHKGLAQACPLFFINSPEFMDYLYASDRPRISSSEIDQIVEILKNIKPAHIL